MIITISDEHGIVVLECGKFMVSKQFDLADWMLHGEGDSELRSMFFSLYKMMAESKA